jgi:hypothetical protein
MKVASHQSTKFVGYVAKILIVLWVASRAGSCVVHDSKLATGFAAISDGMTQDAVKAELGNPWNIRDCRSGEFRPSDLPNCVETYVYSSAWAPLNPWYPVVWFNRDGRVIGKFDISSP